MSRVFALLASLALVLAACDGDETPSPSPTTPTATPSTPIAAPETPTATPTTPTATPPPATATPTPIAGDIEPALRAAVEVYAATEGWGVTGPCSVEPGPATGPAYCYVTPAMEFGDRRRLWLGKHNTGWRRTLWFQPDGAGGYALLVAHQEEEHEPSEPCPVPEDGCRAALSILYDLVTGEFDGFLDPRFNEAGTIPVGDGYDIERVAPEVVLGRLSDWRLSAAAEREDEHGWGEPRLFTVGCRQSPAGCDAGIVAAYSLLDASGARRVLAVFLEPVTQAVTETWFVDEVTPNLEGLLTGGPTTPGTMYRWAPDYFPPTQPTPTPSPDSDPTPVPTPFGTAEEVTGLEPRTDMTVADAVMSLRAYEPPFEPWDGESTTLYDFATGTATNLGTGTLGVFSPDGRFMAWTANWESVRVIDLATGERWDLGPARYVWWVDVRSIGAYLPAGNRVVQIDVLNGEAQTGQRPAEQGVSIEGGYRLHQRGGAVDSTNYMVVRDDGERVRYFDALKAVPAGPGEIAVATRPVSGLTSIYLVDIESGDATFVATSEFGEWNWPLAANARYVAWTDAYCGDPRGRTRILDRETARITEIEATLWVSGFTHGGLLATGAFGPDAVVDPATGEVKAALPGWTPEDGIADSAWSPDYRYGSLGQFGGHGGLCGRGRQQAEQQEVWGCVCS